MRKHYPDNIKAAAIELRNAGHSYSFIQEKLVVSRGALSAWLSKIPYSPNKLSLTRTQEGKFKSAKTQTTGREYREASVKQAVAENWPSLSKDNLFLVGLGLYMGEGSKTRGNIRITNSDPTLILLAVKWFTKSLKVPLVNLTIEMHLYSDCDEQICKHYWSNLTGIKENQFSKSQFDLREKLKSDRTSRASHYGTVQIRVSAKGNSAYGIQLYRFILASIEQAKNMRV